MYPVNLKVEGIPCLVIGGGHIALRKIRKLLKEKALITVLAPEACSEIGDMAVNKDIQLEKKAGITALCEYSLLSDNEYPTYAITKKEITESGIRKM